MYLIISHNIHPLVTINIPTNHMILSTKKYISHNIPFVGVRFQHCGRVCAVRNMKELDRLEIYSSVSEIFFNPLICKSLHKNLLFTVQRSDWK